MDTNRSLNCPGSFRCPICLEDYMIADHVILECTHSICNDCCRIAEKNLRTCPICREPFRKFDLENTVEIVGARVVLPPQAQIVPPLPWAESTRAVVVPPPIIFPLEPILNPVEDPYGTERRLSPTRRNAVTGGTNDADYNRELLDVMRELEEAMIGVFQTRRQLLESSGRIEGDSLQDRIASSINDLQNFYRNTAAGGPAPVVILDYNLRQPPSPTIMAEPVRTGGGSNQVTPTHERDIIFGALADSAEPVATIEVSPGGEPRDESRSTEPAEVSIIRRRKCGPCMCNTAINPREIMIMSFVLAIVFAGVFIASFYWGGAY